MRSTLHQIPTRVGKLAVEEVGSGEPLLLWHGLLFHRGMWADVKPALAERHKLLLVDGPGHGDSEPTRFPYTLWDCAEAATQVLDAFKIGQAGFVGLSWGGMVSLRAAIRFPQRVSSLSLLDSSADAEKRDVALKFAAFGQIFRLFGPLPPVKKEVLSQMYAPRSLRARPELGTMVIDHMKRVDRRALLRALDAVERLRDDVSSSLGGIKIPTLVLCGAEDRATPLFRSLRIAAGIPGARMEVIPNVGHMSALEAPEPVARALLGFLDSL